MVRKKNVGRTPFLGGVPVLGNGPSLFWSPLGVALDLESSGLCPLSEDHSVSMVLFHTTRNTYCLNSHLTR